MTRLPRTTLPDEALSATVSASCTRQSAMRLSTISIAGRTPPTALSASAVVTPGPARSSANTKRDLGHDAWLEKRIDGDLRPVIDEHVVDQHAEVGLGDAEDVLSRLRGSPESAAPDRTSGRDPPPDVVRLDRVGVVEGQIRPGLA